MNRVGKQIFGFRYVFCDKNIDDQGMFSVEGVHEIARLFMSEDPERQKKADHFVEACLSVNDVEVSDGDKGCERAALIFKCRLENAPEYVFIK